MTARRLPGPERPPIGFTLDGAAMTGLAGDTIAAALLVAGIRRVRVTSAGEGRGLWCGMGVCWECLIEVSGEGTMRACVTELREGMVLRLRAGTGPHPA